MPDLAHEFPLDDDLIYLNHAAVSPWPKRTAEAVSRFANENMRRGSLAYLDWLKLEAQLRERLAQLINAPSADTIALVKNTSEGLSLVAHGLEWHTGENIVGGDNEFPSNRIVWESLAPRGVSLRQAPISSADDPEQALFDACDENTRMLAVSSVQYADGLCLNMPRIGRFCRKHNILLCVDAIQSIGALQADVQAWGADFVTADGHKWMMGPEGLGFFYCAPQHLESLQLHQYGWHMVEHVGDFDRRDWQPAASARRFEAGSPNMLAIHALEASLSLLQELGMDEVERRILDNSQFLLEQLTAEPGVELITRSIQSGIVTFRRQERDSVELQAQLQAQGIFCAVRGGGIRFSPHFYTPRHALERALRVTLMT